MSRLRRLVKRRLARWPRAYAWAHRARLVGRYLLRRPHEPDFAAFGRFADRAGVFLDIGGNVGQSALSFRLYNKVAPILSIEANPGLEPDLRLVRRLVRGFDYRICAADERTGTATLHVPVVGRLPVTGEASLEAGPERGAFWAGEQGVGGAVALRRVEVEARRLDDLGLAPAFVKVDVEGGELRALTGLRETLSTHHPVLLLEHSGDARVGAFLAEQGYAPYVYAGDEDRLRPFAGEPAQNVFYLHRDDRAAAG